MGKGRAKRITAADIAREGANLPAFVEKLVKQIASEKENAETKESAAMALRMLASQNHGEHCEVLASAGALVPLIALLRSGTANAQAAAAGALHFILHGKPEAQTELVEKGGVAPVSPRLVIPRLIHSDVTYHLPIPSPASNVLTSAAVALPHRSYDCLLPVVPKCRRRQRQRSHLSEATSATSSRCCAPMRWDRSSTCSRMGLLLHKPLRPRYLDACALSTDVQTHKRPHAHLT